MPEISSRSYFFNFGGKPLEDRLTLSVHILLHSFRIGLQEVDKLSWLCVVELKQYFQPVDLGRNVRHIAELQSGSDILTQKVDASLEIGRRELEDLRSIPGAPFRSARVARQMLDTQQYEAQMQLSAEAS